MWSSLTFLGRADARGIDGLYCNAETAEEVVRLGALEDGFT